MHPPIFEKNKKIDPYERSCSQIKSKAQIKKEKKTRKISFFLYRLIQKHIQP